MSYLVPSHVVSLHHAVASEVLTAQSSILEGNVIAGNASEEPMIPDPHLFQSLSEPALLNNNQHGLPSISECAVHLELLEVFHTLRDRILQSTDLDHTFGIKPQVKTVYRKQYLASQRKYKTYTALIQDRTFQKRRKEKWAYFLELAVVRFVRWIQIADGRLSLLKSSSEKPAGSLLLECLPPLDVLMVWHAFLLNPRDFEWYCITHRLERICKVPFPWLHIHKVINSRDYTYKLSKSHQSILRDMHLEPDLFDALTEVGKRDSHASNIFSQYGTGKRKAATSNYRGNILSHSEIVFAKTVETAISQAGENKPLVDNVIRQAAFVNKMHSHLWIRSPAVEGTVRRAIGRYEKFLQLFQDYPHATLVPTLDIDLIWHTHLCDPEQYRACFLQKVGRVVDHDDKIGKPILDKSFVQMQEMFNVRFGQSYDICLCWDCEAILSAVETLDGIGDMNSIDDLETGVDSAMDNVENDLRYYRAVEIARRKGIGLPICET